MATIRITKGVFPWNNGFVRAGDLPIEVDEALARRLVEEKGVAEYVTPSPVDETDAPDLPDGVTGIPEYSVKNTKAELQEIAALCGLTFDSEMTKAEMVSALDAHIEANMVEGVEVTESGELAPKFDAAEAVQ